VFRYVSFPAKRALKKSVRRRRRIRIGIRIRIRRNGRQLKKMKWEGCLWCTSPHRGCQQKRKLKLLRSLLPYWKTSLGVLFESICDFITSADILLWNLEYSCSFLLWNFAP